MTVIGLTGGIASGKSTAAEMLREFGASIIDADRLGHRSYEPGTRGFTKVVNAFGHDIVGKDGTVDRRVLGGKVFGAPEQMERLNSIVWPEIRGLIREEIAQIRSQDRDAIIVLEAAVLLEAKWEDLCDEIWVVLTPVKTAVERLRNRNGLSEDAAMARIESQMSNKERAEAADVKIENAGTEEQLREKMEKCWAALNRRLGRKAPPRRAPANKLPTKAPKRKSSPKAAASSKTAPKSATGTTASKAAKPKPAAKPAAATKTAPKATARAAGSKPAARPATTKSAATKATAVKSTAGKSTTTKPVAKKPAEKKPAEKKPSTQAAAKTSAKPTARKPAANASTVAAKPAAAKKPAPKASSTAKKAAAKPQAAAARKPAASTRTVAKKAPAARGQSRSK